jgi:hypothetical protein
LYVGGLLENGIKPIRTIGPTFQKIVMKQFAELKNGDRFFYENDISPSKFTLGKFFFILHIFLIKRNVSDDFSSSTQISKRL